MVRTGQMAPLFQRLADAGFDRAYVRKAALPVWWDESVAETPDGYAQTLTLLSRNLGLDLRSLQSETEGIRCRDFGTARFKMKQGSTAEDLYRSHCIAARAAQLACHAMSAPLSELPQTAAEIRATIGKGGRRRVDLSGLLDYCWSMGVPVLHVSRFPRAARKMDGMAARFKGRPVIVLSQNSRYSAWQLFILAHELGHIVLNHLDDSSMVVDEKVERDDDNGHEFEANSFAVELLTGRPDASYWIPRNLTAQQLADAARIAGDRDGIDPGVVALNYAWNKGHWAVGQATLALLEPDADAAAGVRGRMCSGLDWERVPAESQRFLRYVTGIESPV